MKKLLKILCAVIAVMVLSSGAFAMTDNQRWVCHGIIHTASAAGAGSAAALAQAPGTDNLALAGILGTMTVGLAKVFDISLGQTSAESIGVSIIAYFGGTIAARTVSQWIAGWIPLAGNALNAATMAALIEYVGWTIADAFDSGEWVTWKIALSVLTLNLGGGDTKTNPLPSPTKK